MKTSAEWALDYFRNSGDSVVHVIDLEYIVQEVREEMRNVVVEQLKEELKKYHSRSQTSTGLKSAILSIENMKVDI